ncbi:MAG: TPM domain-containing protein [Syntrophales bacterium]|jgi:uncharacterized protein|nr:TPM domain-containing protein [Syntrophales bacterium]
MKNKSSFKIIVSLLFALAFMTFASVASAADAAFPKPAGAINDFAGVIPDVYKAPMENIAREIFQSTGTALVVATIPTIGEGDLNDYANRLYQAWGIGKKGEDKGALILLTVKERRVRIETGYGVEGILPDGLTGEILDQHAVPNFRAGDYGKGLYETLSVIAKIVAKDAGVTIGAEGVNSPPQKQVKPQRKISIFQLLLLIVAAGFLLGTKQGRAMLPWILLLLMNSGGGGRRGGDDGFGGGFGGFGGGMSGGGGSSRGF